MIAEFNYKMQVEHLSKKNKISLHRARTFIKEYRRLLKRKLYEGEKIEVIGVASVYPSIRRSVNEYFEDVYGYERQVEDLTDCLPMETFEVHHLLRSYLGMLISRLNMGYAIKISGVFSFKPERFGDGNLGYVVRLSPSLDKPDSMKLRIKHTYGDIEELDIEKGRLIYRLEISESLEPPQHIRILDEEIKKNITYLDDSFLG